MLSRAQRTFASTFQQSRSAVKTPAYAGQMSNCEKRYPLEPAAPLCPTEFPGPKSKAYTKELGEMTCTLTNMFPVDTANSLGNYVADVDGNQYLDMFMAIASISLGYNHPVMLKKAQDEIVQQQLITRSGIGVHPEKHYIDVC